MIYAIPGRINRPILCFFNESGRLKILSPENFFLRTEIFFLRTEIFFLRTEDFFLSSGEFFPLGRRITSTVITFYSTIYRATTALQGLDTSTSLQLR